MEENELSMSPMRMAATQLHEMYTELRKAGFTRYEALFLVSRMLLGEPGTGD